MADSTTTLPWTRPAPSAATTSSASATSSRRPRRRPAAAAALGLLLGVLALGAVQAGEDTGIARVEVDLREAPRGVLKVHLTLPVTAGPVTLVYPKWLPGRHGPAGPITNLAGPRLTALGHPVPWRRDDVDMYALH